MINITKDCLNALKKDALQLAKITVTPLNSPVFTITEKNIVLGGLKIESHCVDGEVIQIGNLTSAVLNLKLDNDAGTYNDVFFAGAQIFVQIGITLENNTIDWIPKGKYTVDEQPRTGSIIELEAFDNVVKLDKPFNYKMYPTSRRQLVRSGIESCGLQCSDYSMFSDDFDITNQLSADTTWRQIIMWCCQIDGLCGIADENGKIIFKWYSKSNMLHLKGFSIAACDRFQGASIDEKDTVLSGHQFVCENKKYPGTVDSKYLLQTSDNLIFANTDELSQINKSNSVDTLIKNFTYRGYNCDTLSYPMLQPLDLIVYAVDNKRIETLITNVTYELNGKMNLSAKAMSQQAKGYASLGALTSSQKVIINGINDKVDKTNNDLTDRSTALLQLNELMNGAGGFYEEIVIEKGEKIYYRFDKPTKEESKIIYKSNVGGTVWTNNGWNNGTPIWQYGSTNDGNAVLNTIHAKKIAADDVKTGLLMSTNDASFINMDDGTFDFGSIDGLKRLSLLSLKNKTLHILGKSCSGTDTLRTYNFVISTKIFNDTTQKYDLGEGAVLAIAKGADKIALLDKLYGMTQTEEYEINISTIMQLLQSCEFVILQGDITMSKITGSPNSIEIYSKCEIKVKSDRVEMVTRGDTISISNNLFPERQWINYYGDSQSPTVFLFGNGTQGGYASLQAAAFNTASDRTLKSNIVALQNHNALDMIKNLKFYSYDFKNPYAKATSKAKLATENPNKALQSNLHIDIGLMADEAPKDIQSADGKAIDLYQYISLTAKALQELTSEVATLKLKIKEEKQ